MRIGHHERLQLLPYNATRGARGWAWPFEEQVGRWSNRHLGHFTQRKWDVTWCNDVTKNFMLGQLARSNLACLDIWAEDIQLIVGGTKVKFSPWCPLSLYEWFTVWNISPEIPSYTKKIMLNSLTSHPRRLFVSYFWNPPSVTHPPMVCPMVPHVWVATNGGILHVRTNPLGYLDRTVLYEVRIPQTKSQQLEAQFTTGEFDGFWGI